MCRYLYLNLYLSILSTFVNMINEKCEYQLKSNLFRVHVFILFIIHNLCRGFDLLILFCFHFLNNNNFRLIRHATSARVTIKFITSRLIIIFFSNIFFLSNYQLEHTGSKIYHDWEIGGGQTL